MNNLISRHDAIKAYCEHRCGKGMIRGECGCDDCGTIFDDIPSAQRWIPCGERLPDDYADVLVWFEYYRFGEYNRMYSTYGIGNYDGGYDMWIINHETGWRDLHVFAWMPLPEPYKGGEA